MEAWGTTVSTEKTSSLASLSDVISIGGLERLEDYVNSLNIITCREENDDLLNVLIGLNVHFNDTGLRVYFLKTVCMFLDTDVGQSISRRLYMKTSDIKEIIFGGSDKARYTLLSRLFFKCHRNLLFTKHEYLMVWLNLVLASLPIGDFTEFIMDEELGGKVVMILNRQNISKDYCYQDLGTVLETFANRVTFDRNFFVDNTALVLIIVVACLNVYRLKRCSKLMYLAELIKYLSKPIVRGR